jgi:transposase
MRSKDVQKTAMWSYISPEARVPADHPLRPMREMVNGVLKALSPEVEKIYSGFGRPSIPPERLLRALLLQVLYTVRSERMLMEQLNYNMLFRWFIGLNMDDPVWDVTVFTKNRERFLEGEIAEKFFAAVLDQARKASLLSDEHFTVDGTLVEAWASHKRFKPKDGGGSPPADGTGKNPDVNFKGRTRSSDTHASTTDPDARLYKKSAGSASKLGYLGHVMTENRHGLVVDSELTFATGTAEREAALAMVGRLPAASRITVGGDKGYRVDASERIRKVGRPRDAGIGLHLRAWRLLTRLGHRLGFRCSIRGLAGEPRSHHVERDHQRRIAADSGWNAAASARWSGDRASGCTEERRAIRCFAFAIARR